MSSRVYTYDYDSGYIPAFPVAEVVLNGFDQPGEGIQVNALVDSGSDATAVPLLLLRQVGARKVGRAVLRGMAGGRRVVNLYEVALRLAGQDVPRLEVVGDKESQEVILGRDILNFYVVTLNGLANVVEIWQ